MSAGDFRDDLADIAASVRRYLERESASGTADLLVRGAAAARGRGAAGEKPATPMVPRPVAEEARTIARSTAGSIGPEAAALRPAPRPAPTPVGPGPGPGGGDPSVATETPGSERTLSLFGESESDPAVAAHAGGRLDYGIELPPVHPPLHPRGPDGRAEIQATAMPILDQLAAATRECRKCGLCETRTHAVPGIGSARSGIVFVGEAPGADEDAQGEPFVGRAGQLLTRIIAAMDEAMLIPGVPLSRDTVYICNVLKCRPPENRNPLPHEIETCSPYLRGQLEALRPRIICCLGKFAAELLVGVKGTIAGLRGKVYRYHGAKLIVTYHPAACLRNPGYKRPVWEDMQLLAREYLA